MSQSLRPFVSRAGNKLVAALDAFALDPRGACCADLGCHAGGFVDCLLRRGAARVYAVDTGYGVLDWSLRKDPRVVVFERTNALHFIPPTPCKLVTIDVGWTPQRLILPAARRMLEPDGRVVTLIKPQYEAPRAWLSGGVLQPERAAEVCDLVRAAVRENGWEILAELQSPLRGHGGNTEYLWLLRVAPAGA